MEAGEKVFWKRLDFIGGVVLALIIWGASLMGVQTNIYLGAGVFAAAFCLIIHGLYVDGKVRQWGSFRRWSLIAGIGVVCFLAVGWQFRKQWQEEHKSTAASSTEIAKSGKDSPKQETVTPQPPPQQAAPLAKKPSFLKQPEKIQPSSSDHVAVRVEKGAKWISTDDTVYAPGGTGIENKGEITSKGLRVIAPQTSSPIQNCPNGVCIGGDNSGTATVNNFGPLPAKIATWDQKAANWQEKEGLVPETQLTLTVDRLMEVPAFFVKCDRPCRVREAVVFGAYNKLDYLTASDPTISGAVFLSPRPLGSGIKVEYRIRGTDGAIPQVQVVGIIKPEQLPPKDR